MKKLATIWTLLSLLTLNTISNIAFADSFSDLSPVHPNFQAINYLQENNILNGYPDGSFGPDLEVNRAEFLTIVLEGSGIETNITSETPFSDVNHSAWYAPYVKKAYAEGWIDGYDDGTFKPEQTINKAESLKILGEVQAWETPTYVTTQPFDDVYKTAWFTPYVSYAKTRNFLEETGNIFAPADNMTRAKISEVIYRTLTEGTEINESVIIEDDSNEEEIPQTEEPDTANQDSTEAETTEESITQTVFTPRTYAVIPTNFYNTISLNKSIPNTFYKDEVYVISGEVTSGDSTIVTAILEGQTDENFYETFTATITNNEFEIPVYFPQEGNYYLGLIPGENGESKAAGVSVLFDLPGVSGTSSDTIAINSLDLKFQNDQTLIQTNATASKLKKFIFSQGSKKITYLNRQNLTSIPIKYKNFKDFSENQSITLTAYSSTFSSEQPLQLSSNFTEAIAENWEIAEHTYSFTNTEKISTSPPSQISSSSTISFSGTTYETIYKTAYIIKPDGFVEEIELSTNSPTGTYIGAETILADGNFTFTYNPTEPGRYIVEINDTSGVALLNHPVYVGSNIPLTPDFFDLHERDFFTDTFNVSELRAELLDFINTGRENHGLPAINDSSELNSLAQAHSDDMSENGFFAHINLDGQTPDDRRVEAGILTPVSENIAQDTSVESGHWGLMRSAAHRQNILDSEWDRVGLGISLSNGYLYIAEEFSTNELTNADLEDNKDELFNAVNDLRNTNGMGDLIYNSKLEQASSYLVDKEIAGDSLTQDTLIEALNLYEVGGVTEALGRIHSNWAGTLSSILEESSIIEELWTAIGIDIQLDETGNLYTILMLNY